MSNESNPILNNPYEEPRLHYATDLDGNLNYSITSKGRRIFNPISFAMPTNRRDGQMAVFESNDFQQQFADFIINLLRTEVGQWRNDGYPNTTRVTKELLTFWFCNSNRLVTKQLFFAQREAVETAIWINEVAARSNVGNSILTRLQDYNQVSADGNADLPRIAFKMATGSGKTVVMATLILYHYFNRQTYRNDTRFADNFLLVAPGITIRDRLNVLFVDTSTTDRNRRNDYYNVRALVPDNYVGTLDGLNARISITNYHAFEPRTLQGNKKTPFDGKPGADGKKPDSKEPIIQTLNRIMGEFKLGSRLLIINDEAHHCYLPKQKTTKNDDDNSVEENERAALWYRGLVEVSKRYKVSRVYDLSATPYFLSNSGYDSYSLFPWTVTDFGLTEAIESGLVKIPFIPDNDTSQNPDMPVYRELYRHIEKDLPRRRKATDKSELKPNLPSTLRMALDSFYKHYHDDYHRISNLFGIPPVFIVVCNNTYVSKEVFKYLAGYELRNEKGEVTDVVPSSYGLFSNFDENSKQPLRKSPTLLIDSYALENGEQINDEFKRVFAPEIDRFKQDYRILHPGKSVSDISDSDLLREIVNNVGRPNTLGGHIRCVVSVSMLTEGWDANTVTHIVGIRAFGSYLLCEQVAGRALRRKHYTLQAYTHDNEPIDEKNLRRYKPENIKYKFPPEYAHIIGIPFQTFKGGKTPQTPITKEPKRIYALPERKQLEILFPNVVGYRVHTENQSLTPNFTGDNFTIDGSKVPLKTIMQTAFSYERQELTVDIGDLREQQIYYILVNELIKKYYHDDDNQPLFHQFNQLKSIVEEWYQTKVQILGNTGDVENPKNAVVYYVGLAAEHINNAIIKGQQNKGEVLPVFNHYRPFGSTADVNGLTTREVYATHKSPINYVVADTESWEQRAAKSLDDIPAVKSFVKNAFLNFRIPYVKAGVDNPFYEPDFIARCETPSGQMINLIVEISGMNQDKETKRNYVQTRWLPAVNAVRDTYKFDEWHFIEIAKELELSDMHHIITQKLHQLA